MVEGQQMRGAPPLFHHLADGVAAVAADLDPLLAADRPVQVEGDAGEEVGERVLQGQADDDRQGAHAEKQRRQVHVVGLQVDEQADDDHHPGDQHLVQGMDVAAAPPAVEAGEEAGRRGHPDVERGKEEGAADQVERPRRFAFGDLQREVPPAGGVVEAVADAEQGGALGEAGDEQGGEEEHAGGEADGAQVAPAPQGMFPGQQEEVGEQGVVEDRRLRAGPEEML